MYCMPITNTVALIDIKSVDVRIYTYVAIHRTSVIATLYQWVAIVLQSLSLQLPSEVSVSSCCVRTCISSSLLHGHYLTHRCNPTHYHVITSDL